ncbi:MAG: Hsp20/alpha crystallin family protein [Gemmatimonadales bacterium]|nr:Hsp20/alpha crystallin family protein [Gemmatimonadota bacterium]MCC7131202.1 Hsp20/alpha crystallin family protein [Gemmatimonadales bacterium]MDX2058364.1 Hsp20/alpha crystallin family protein [Gemmatimonadales bacterium]
MLVRWAARPAQPMNSWREINRVIDETFGLGQGDGWFDRAWAPAVDVTEDQKAYLIALELPGVKPDDVKIHLDGNRLIVSGEKKQEAEERTDRLHRFERRFGTFSRTFTLPETVNTEAIEARAQNGVLTLTLPKSEKAQPRTIPVSAS